MSLLLAPITLYSINSLFLEVNSTKLNIPIIHIKVINIKIQVIYMNAIY